MYETTADLMEDWHYSRIDADMEMREMQQAAAQREADRKAGNCWHDGGYGFRWTAFYPEQVGMFVGEMFCYDCREVVQDPSGPDCFVCDLDRYNCMGERGVGGEGKYAHEAFVMPPLVCVGYAE